MRSETTVRGWFGAQALWMRPGLWLGLIVVLGLTVRLIHLGTASLWNDELFSIFYSRVGFRFMWTEGLSLEPDPPLYYSFVLAWQHLWGVSETAIRSLSVLFSLLAIPLVYALGVELQDRRHALVGAFLLALAPMQIHFAQDARAYSLTLLPAGLMLFGLARCLRHRPRLGDLACFAAGAILGIYTHTTLILLIVACNIAALTWMAARGGPGLPRDALRWVLTNIAVALAGIPEALGMLRIMAAHRYAPRGPALTRFQFADVFSEMFAGPAAPLRLPGLELAALALLAIALGIWMRPPARRTAVVLAGVPCGYFAIALGLTLALHTPLLVARVFCWASIPASLLFAHALLQTRCVTAIRLSLAVVFLTGLVVQFGRAADPIEPWRMALPGLKADMSRAEMVVLMPLTSAGAFTLYAPEVGHLNVLRFDGPETVETGFMPARMGVPTVEVADIARQINARKDVWIVGKHEGPELDRLLAEVPQPARRVEYECANGKTCILALHWHLAPQG